MTRPLEDLYTLIISNPVVIIIVTLVIIAVLIKILHWIQNKW